MRQDVKALLATVLWAETNLEPDEPLPLEETYDVDDFAPQSATFVAEEIDAFMAEAGPLLGDGYDPRQVAHDLWLTAKGHGAGFWDGDYRELGKALTAMAKATALASTDVYAGDDGLLYFSGHERGR